MDLELNPQDLTFQAEVRTFLDEHLTPELRAAGARLTSVFCEPRYLNNRPASIYGGSNEIQRDIIARLVLGQ